MFLDIEKVLLTSQFSQRPLATLQQVVEGHREATDEHDQAWGAQWQEVKVGRGAHLLVAHDDDDHDRVARQTHNQDARVDEQQHVGQHLGHVGVEWRGGRRVALDCRERQDFYVE